MWDAARTGDWATARARHYRIQPLTRLLFAEASPAPSKAALELMGVCGPELRAPLAPCTDELRAKLRERLTVEGLL
jgi:4-hydroxy-tetrahydrodipicolinate synthase